MTVFGGSLLRNKTVTSVEITRSLLGIAPAEQLRSTAADQSTSQGHLSRRAMVLSPDGRIIVFSALRGPVQQLYFKRLDQLDATPIPGTDDAESAFISTDGKWIGFWAKGALKKVALAGEGPVTTLCDTPAIFGASWGSDDTIIFDRITGGLWEVSAAGGMPKSVTTVDAGKGEFSHRLPQILPANKAVIFTITTSLLPSWDDTQIVVQSLVTNERKILVNGGANGTYYRPAISFMSAVAHC